MKSKSKDTKSLPPMVTCRGCLEDVTWGEKGTCWHEAGWAHHLACPVNPEAEDALTDLASTDPDTTTEPLKSAPTSTNDKEEKK